MVAFYNELKRLLNGFPEKKAFFIAYFIVVAISLSISYLPGFCFESSFAAVIAPFAKTVLLAAEWEMVMTSSLPAKIISCSPTIVPPRTA